MSLDTYDTHSPLNPSNQEELPEAKYSELEEQQDWNQELCKKIHKMKNDFKILKDIEEMFTTFGKLTFEEQKQKQEILNKY